MRKFIPQNTKLIPKQAELKFSGEIFDVYQWPQEMFDGSIETFEMLDRADTAIVIAIKDDKIIITHQKQPREDWFYAYPGGRIDKDDTDELAGAQRELLEETGMRFANWKLINAKQPYAKINWITYTFLATEFLDQGAQHLDAGEKIDVLELSFDEYVELLRRPDASNLRLKFVDGEQLKSLQDLIDLPALYNY